MGQILLIGDDRERCKDVRQLLRQDGHDVAWLRDLPSWREREPELRPEVVVAATPRTDRVLETPGRVPRGFPAPILFVQHQDDRPGNLHLDERLVDRLASPFSAEELLARVDALVRMRRVVLRAPGRHEPEDIPRSTWGARIARLLGQRIPRFSRPSEPYHEVATRLAAWADDRDMFRPGHAERVTGFCSMIADALNLPDHEAGTLLRASMLHDIGKVGLPVEILRSSEPLADEHLVLIRTHPERGAELLEVLERDPEVARTIRYHHERMDGMGYYGLAPEEIPRTARILAVAEAYDAMTSSQINTPLSFDRALNELKNHRGSSYEPECVDALVDCLKPRPIYLPVSRIGPPQNCEAAGLDSR